MITLFFAQVAQVVSDSPALYSYGPLGIMCAWLMWRDERRGNESRTVAHRIDGLSRVLLVDMTERDTCGQNTKRFAREEIAKIEARMTKNEPR